MGSEENHSRRKRRWLRFSLRSFLVVITIGCVLLGYWVYRAEEQRRVVRWAENHGAYVAYSIEVENMNGMKPTTYVPTWLCNLVGIDYFYSVVSVMLSNDREFENIAPLAKLTYLRSLHAYGSGVSDLSPLAGLSNLTDLNMHDTQVSDLSPLSGLSNLTHLKMDDTQVSDLSPLSGLPHLRTLTLDNTKVSDLKPLKGAKELEYLSLVSTPVSDLEALRDLRNLQILVLHNTDVADVTPLSRLPNLRGLGLENTNVTERQKDDFRDRHAFCVIW